MTQQRPRGDVFARMGFAMCCEGASREDAIGRAAGYASGDWGHYSGDLGPEAAGAAAASGWDAARRRKREYDRLTVDGDSPCSSGQAGVVMSGNDARSWSSLLFRTRPAEAAARAPRSSSQILVSVSAGNVWTRSPPARMG
jgi:hypothetical protein